MTSPNRRKSEKLPDRGFQHSLRLLQEIRLWAVWSGTVALLLLPAMILLLCSPAAIFLGLGSFTAKSVAGGVLGLIWAASVLALYRQWSGLTAVRKALIQQIDAAAKNSVRAERLYGLSILDPLTGLYNRRFGETRLEEEIAKAEGSEDPLVVLAMDFDKFKHINDTLGHDAGDMALKEFSRRLQRAVRACDVPIRVGGDEFLVILPDCPPSKVQTIMSRMDQIEFPLNGKRIRVSFSYGMAQYQVADTSEAMIKRADQRLYDVKAEKKAARAGESTAARPKVAYGPLEPAATPREPVRRSVRLPTERPVLLVGSDLHGKGFTEETVTLDVSRHGATILSCRKLAAGQEVIVRCLDTNQEAEARIVRVAGSRPDDFTYGLAFVDPAVSIWGIQFPPSQQTEKEQAGSLFACTRCGGREALNPVDGACGDAPSETILRSCQRCDSETAWGPVVTAPVVSGGLAAVTRMPEPAPAFAGEKSA